MWRHNKYLSSRFGLLSVYLLGAIILSSLIGAILVLAIGIVSQWLGKMAARERLRAALKGKIAPKELSVLLANPLNFHMEASEQVITLMFIDIVGFALASEGQNPKEAFSHLKNQMNYLTAAVHKFGGIVDKSLGDGLFCYFGYYHDGLAWERDHASRALECAKYIQEENVRRILSATLEDNPVYPLRIGINTAAVYIGDIGDDARVDFTVIGHGVNYAQRLEAACDPNLVMVSTATRSLLNMKMIRTLNLEPKYVQFKHREELTEAFEFNPFAGKSDALTGAIDAYRKFAGINRLDCRWQVPSNSGIWVETDFGAGRLINFSASGFQVVFSRYIAKGAKLNLRIETKNEHLRETLLGMGLVPVNVEVRWAAAETSGCLHGVQIKGLSSDKRRFLMATLREALSRYGDLKRAA